MKHLKFTRAGVFLFLLNVVGCTKQSERVGSFEVPSITYTLSQFTNFQQFQGKLMGKSTGIYTDKLSDSTNFYFNIFLEKTNGDKFFVRENPASHHFFQVVNTLEDGQSYTFPQKLTDQIKQ